MVSVSQALNILFSVAKTLPVSVIPLEQSLRYVSADDVYAAMNVPSFDNSAMDGYAIRFKDYENNSTIKITVEIQAGVRQQVTPLQENEASKIFTGAPIPDNCDAVVPIEDVRVVDNGLIFIKPVALGANIRKLGTQTIKGQLVLQKGTTITAEIIGFLATLGIAHLKVISKPKVGLIITGKELIPIGADIQQYQIYDSNSVFLKAALGAMNIEPEFVVRNEDIKEVLKQTILEMHRSVDVLIITGGISVGDYDFVKPVLEELNAKEVFYKVKQKPGKPLYGGLLNQTTIFGLPGNPASVVACFHIYVKPFLSQLIGRNPDEILQKASLVGKYQKKIGLTHFLKAYVSNGNITLLNNQLSYQMDAFVHANSLAILPEAEESFEPGCLVEFISFT